MTVIRDYAAGLNQPTLGGDPHRYDEVVGRDGSLRAPWKGLAERAVRLTPGDLARADDDIVLQGGMAFAGVPACAAERYALIERDIVADDRRFTDDHAEAVIDEKPTTDGYARMNFDTGEPARDMRYETPQPGQPMRPAPVRHAMPPQRMQARIGKDHFPDAARGRVALEDGVDVLTHARDHEMLRAP